MVKGQPTDPILYEKVKKEVKQHVHVWPSAYASGQLVKAYKTAFSQEHGSQLSPYIDVLQIETEPLTRWFSEEWVNVCEKGKDGKYKKCGRDGSNPSKDQDYPYCRPLHHVNKHTPKTVTEFTAQELKELCSYKRSLFQGLGGKPTRIYHKQVLQDGGSPVDFIIVRELSPEEKGMSSKKFKKYAVEILDPSGSKKVYFGHNQYEDYTLHKDPSRWENYIRRHKKRENWDLSGIDTPGFWSRWLLWNKPSFVDSIKDIEQQFKVKIINNTMRRD